VTRIALKQIIRRQTGADALVSALAQALGTVVTIEDADGRLLHGEVAANDQVRRFPVTLQDTRLGWVSGSDSAGMVAAVVQHLAGREAEQKALGAEVLHLYREINLIYSFSEKLAALLDVERVARLTLQEARHLIAATDSAIMLLDQQSGTLSVIAASGEALASADFHRDRGIVGAVAASGVGEIVNNVAADARRNSEPGSIAALICAPLKVGERVIGVIALGNAKEAAYSAADLKLLTTLALQTATAIENARLFERTIEAARERERLQALHQAAELARTKLESELTLASRIQSNLFPSELPAVEGYQLAARNRPARLCGGDYYDAVRTTKMDGSEGVLLCVADVAGKGLPAALVMSNMQATLRALAGRVPELPLLAGHASDLLFAATSEEKYVTAALAELSPVTGQIRFVGAGHLDNVIVRADGSILTLVSTGLPLGLMDDRMPYGDATHTLEAGDTVVLYSDGITDAQNTDGEEYGEARLHDLLQSLVQDRPEAIANGVLASVDAFVKGAPQFDDMTILVLRRN